MIVIHSDNLSMRYNYDYEGIIKCYNNCYGRRLGMIYLLHHF